MPKKHTPSMGKSRFSFFIVDQYKERIRSALEEGRALGILPMSCDDLSAFINDAVGKELNRVESAIRSKKSS